jgi:hypothetical protein
MSKSRVDPPPSPDPEAELFCRLVARVLAWPCPRCGKAGLCDCFALVAAGDEGRVAEEGQCHER